jgi:type IV secretory pathway VirB2 component (pilin)
MRSTSTAQAEALVVGAHWIENLLTRSVGVAIAVLAIALVGIALLSGYYPLRRGIKVALGCFILFGAQSIARSLVDAVSTATPAVIQTEARPMSDISFPKQSPQFDPFAGASVPAQ